MNYVVRTTLVLSVVFLLFVTTVAVAFEYYTQVNYEIYPLVKPTQPLVLKLTTSTSGSRELKNYLLFNTHEKPVIVVTSMDTITLKRDFEYFNMTLLVHKASDNTTVFTSTMTLEESKTFISLPARDKFNADVTIDYKTKPVAENVTALADIQPINAFSVLSFVATET